MKLINFILGLVVIFLGLLPILVGQGIAVLSVIPNSGNMYQGLIILAGVIIAIMNYKASSYSGLRYRR